MTPIELLEMIRKGLYKVSEPSFSSSIDLDTKTMSITFVEPKEKFVITCQRKPD